MALPNYVSLSRHNVYYFRYPLPKELRPAPYMIGKAAFNEQIGQHAITSSDLRP